MRLDFSVRVGRDRAGRNAKGQFDSKLKKSFDASSNAAASTLKEYVEELVLDKVGDVVVDTLYARFVSKKTAHTLERVINADLARYMRVTTRYATDITTQRGRRAKFTITEDMASEGAEFSQRPKSGIRQLPTHAGAMWTWPALAPKTLERKSRAGNPNKYFVQTGDLRRQLLTLLPNMAMKALHPIIEIVIPKKVNLRARNRNPLVGTFNLKLATTNMSGVSQLPFMNGEFVGHSRHTVRTTLLRSFMENQLHAVNEDLLIKLRNSTSPASPRPQRPWIDQAISYWVLVRLPGVLQNSVQKALNEALKGT